MAGIEAMGRAQARLAVKFGAPDRDTLALSGALTFATAARA